MMAVTAGPRCKICPACKEGALLSAQTCAKCGHIFRTEFAPKVVAGNPPIAATPGLPPAITPAPKKRIVRPYLVAGGLVALMAINGRAQIPAQRITTNEVSQRSPAEKAILATLLF